MRAGDKQANSSANIDRNQLPPPPQRSLRVGYFSSKQGGQEYLVSVGNKQDKSSANIDRNQLPPPLIASADQVSRASDAITWRN